MRRLLTMEDNPKTIINVAGDYVQSKHVDYEINNVEAGGIGIQFVNGKQTTIKPSASSTRKHDTSIPYTIRYINANEQSRTQRLLLLMRCLQKLQWIEEPKSADDFIDLFDGKPRECNIKWTDTLYFNGLGVANIKFPIIKIAEFCSRFIAFFMCLMFSDLQSSYRRQVEVISE